MIPQASHAIASHTPHEGSPRLQALLRDHAGLSLTQSQAELRFKRLTRFYLLCETVGWTPRPAAVVHTPVDNRLLTDSAS